VSSSQGRDLDYFRQLTSERPLRRFVKGVAAREWRKDPGVRNEALDCRVYATAALHGLYASGLRLGEVVSRIESAALSCECTTSSTVQKPIQMSMNRSSWMD